MSYASSSVLQSREQTTTRRLHGYTGRAPMNEPVVGGQVRVHLRGSDHQGEVVALSRSRATVRYIDRYGDERTVKVPLTQVYAAG